MASSKTMRSPDETEGEIIITTRAIIGRVPFSQYGVGSPVIAAFEHVAKYLDEQGAEGNEAEVEFDFLGTHFLAGVNQR